MNLYSVAVIGSKSLPLDGAETRSPFQGAFPGTAVSLTTCKRRDQFHAQPIPPRPGECLAELERAELFPANRNLTDRGTAYEGTPRITFLVTACLYFIIIL